LAVEEVVAVVEEVGHIVVVVHPHLISVVAEVAVEQVLLTLRVAVAVVLADKVLL
jgi:hypothetical protein